MKKTRTRIGSILLAIALVLSLLPVTAMAEEGDAYTTLKEAVEAAPTNGTRTTITLTGDISGLTTEQILTIKEGQNIVLDMAGYEITVDSNFMGRPIKNCGTLTVTGNGTIDSSESDTGGYGAIDNYGILTIKNGTYTGSVNASGASIKNRPDGVLTIEDGTFNGAVTAVYNEGITRIYDGLFDCRSCSACNSNSWGYTIQSHKNANGESPELYFYDGTVIGVQGGFSTSAGYSEIHGGTFKTVSCEKHPGGSSAFYALYIAGEDEDVKCVVYDGYFESVSQTAALIGNDNTGGDGGINADATTEIKGGTFVASTNQNAVTGAKNTGNPIITGGTFSSNVSEYVADGYEIVPQGDQWVVGTLDDLAVAQVGEQKYTSLSKAIGAAQDGGTVTLLRNTTYNNRLNISKDTTLDLGGYTLTSSTSHSFVVYPDQSFTLKNGTLENDMGTAVFGLKGSTITVERGAKIEACDGIVATNSTVEEGNAIINVYGTINSTDIAIWLQGPKNTVNLDGATITANYFAVYQNGSFGGGIYNIKNSMIENGPEAGPAIYISNNKTNAENPDQGMQTLIAENSTIVGSTGIEVKFTNVTLTDCTVTATTAEPWFDQFNNGSTTAGFSVVATDNTMEPNSPAPSGTISIDGGYYTGLVGLGSLVDKEKYPDFKETSYVISNGYFTNDPSAYVAPGYAAVDNSGDTVYQYKVVVAGENAAQVVTGEADVSVSESITDNDEKTLAESVADALTNPGKGGTEQPDIGEALNAAASTVANQNQVTAEEGKAKLKDASVSVSDADNVTIVVQPYLEISVADVAIQDEIQTVTLDITPKYITVATTANVDEGEKLNFAEDEGTTNAVQVGEAKKLNVTKPVTVTLSLPDNFVAAGALYVKHVKDNGRTYYYKGNVAENVLTFTNPNGFSLFSFSTTNSEVVAAIGDEGYASLAEAIAAVESGGTIELLVDNLSATVSRPVSFNVAGDGADSVRLSAGNGYEMKKSSNTYTFTYVGSSSGSNSGNGSDDDDGYGITVPSSSSIRGGSISVSPRSAEKGDTVTITVKPDDGYVLDELTVTARNGGEVDLTRKNSSQYTFKMPAGSVVIEVSFIKEEDAPTAEMSFGDVPESYWAYSEIQWAYENGYMNGTSATTFNPTGTVTRQQVWMILARMSGANPANMAAAKTWAEENGISDGTNPGGAVTRQQLVSLLYRFAGQMGYDTNAKADLSSYPDAGAVASYATDAMAWAVANSIVGGTTQGTLNPAGTANRAQFAVILWRFYQTSAN